MTSWRKLFVRRLWRSLRECSAFLLLSLQRGAAAWWSCCRGRSKALRTRSSPPGGAMGSRLPRLFAILVTFAAAGVAFRWWRSCSLEFGVHSLQLSFLKQRRCGDLCNESSPDACGNLQDADTNPASLPDTQQQQPADARFSRTRNAAAKGCRSDSGKPEVRHVAYVKIHKTGSTTLQNVFFRFGLSRDLTFVLPRARNYLDYMLDTASIRKSLVLPPPTNRTFDLICCHVTFNYTVFRQYVQPDTVYLASVREPVARLRSAFHYFRQTPYMAGVQGPDPFQSFVKQIYRLEPKQPSHSLTNNRMAQDLGFHDLGHAKEDVFRGFLRHLDSVLDLVLVSELFDESVVLLRRRLGWGVKDVLYVKKNVRRSREGREPDQALPDYLQERAKTFLKWDVLLYRHFRQKLERRMAEAGEDFPQEVTFFKTALQQVHQFCSSSSSSSSGGGAQQTTIRQSPWNEEFDLTRTDCYFMNMDEMTFFSVLRHRHLDQLRQRGSNEAFMRRIPESPAGSRFLKDLTLTLMSYEGTIMGE